MRLFTSDRFVLLNNGLNWTQSEETQPYYQNTIYYFALLLLVQTEHTLFSNCIVFLKMQIFILFIVVKVHLTESNGIVSNSNFSMLLSYIVNYFQESKSCINLHIYLGILIQK